MQNFFNRNPITSMQSLRDRAERIGVTYLEEQAVNGTITESMVETVARTLNTDFDEYRSHPRPSPSLTPREGDGGASQGEAD